MIFDLDAIPKWGLWGNLRSVLASADVIALAGFGELYTTETAATAIANTSDYVDLAGTWEIGQGRDFDESAGNGRLTYTGTADIEVILSANASVTVAGNNDIIHLRLEKNGTAVTSSDSIQKVTVGDDVASMASLGVTSMSTGDWIVMAVRNETAADNVTALNAHLVATGLAL